MKLPQLDERSGLRPAVQTGFGGLDHNLSAGDGALYGMENLSGREFPLLVPRRRRGRTGTLTAPGGIGALDEAWWVDGTGFYYGGTRRGSVTPGQKQFAAMGSRVLIFPDKKYYDFAAEEFGSMEERWSGTLSFRNGTYAGVSARANTLHAPGAAWAFRAGDAVTVSGCVLHPENNKTVVVREAEGDELRFYENSFTLDTCRLFRAEDSLAAGTYHFTPEDTALQFTLSAALSAGDTLSWDGSALTVRTGGASSALAVTPGSGGTELTFGEAPADYTESGTVTLLRSVPDLDCVCVNENRLWGCRGDTIYASALGDPFNFNVFDGLSTDSWQSGTVDAGDFTACISFMGYPIFFKEEAVYKVYGDRPDNFQWTPSARLGVRKGCSRSLAVAGETLFYLSRAGVCAYTGGIPAVISGALGADARWENASAGSDGVRYYVSMSDGASFSLFVYDTRYKVWHREDASHALGFAFWDGSLSMLCDDGNIWRLDGGKGEAEPPVSWMAEFADFTRFYAASETGSQNKKGLLRLQLRCALEAGSSVAVSVMYDSDGLWREIGSVTGPAAKRSYNLPLLLRRCDHFRLKLTGVGESVIYSLTEVKYSGSNLQGGALTKEE
jgi:hypothetical protein